MFRPFSFIGIVTGIWWCTLSVYGEANPSAPTTLAGTPTSVSDGLECKEWQVKPNSDSQASLKEELSIWHDRGMLDADAAMISLLLINMSPVFWNEIRLFDGTLKTCDAKDSSEPPPPSSLKVQAYETFPEVGEKRLADFTLNFDKTEDLIFHDEQPQVPIWPAVVDKFMKMYRQTDNRLLDTDGKLYDCGNDHSEVERRQMCRYATILTRITGKRFQSTTRIIDKNKKLNDKYLFSLVNKYTHGLTYVMTDNALTHIVKSSKDEHNFYAVTVDHQNIGPLKEHGVAFKSIKPLSESLKGQVVPFKEIRAKENGKVSREQDIHIIHFHEKSLPIAKSTTMPQSSPTQ